jgi:hypothetical protein
MLALLIDLTLDLVLLVCTSECNLMFLYIFVPNSFCLFNDKQKTEDDRLQISVSYI